VGTIQGSIGGIVVNFTQFTLQVLIGITILVSLNAKMGILALIAIPLYVVNFRYFRPKIREGNITARRANTAIYNRVEERISAIKTVKVFGREMAEVRNFAVAANNLARLTMYILRNQSWQTVFATAISGITTGLIMYLGMKSLQDGSMTMGRVMWFYSCAVNLFAPAVALSDLVAMEMPRINVVMRRVFDLLEAEPETADRPNAISLANANGDVTFKDVSFTYPGDEESTLHNVSFSVPSGAQIAVMGPSGAGKSSLLYLLMRFYDPDSGTIELDGHDLRDLTLLSMRDRVTLVMQEPVIFSGTVSENIRYGRLDASDNDVITAAKNADLHNFINTLPDRYDTIVGERGMALSGGQRQRLALAASLISRPSVLLLDDTTSALDPVTEARVRVTLNKLMKGKTCFVVTHRISTAMTSDYIIVLENGTVSQFGTPNQLLQDEGLVKRIFEQQSGEGAGE
ncbi:MAG: ABC transporter ATP-binding protein, partial [bacterium]